MYVCPKCRGEMRTYDRSGIQIEQCSNCRGIFLDYGELESLTNLEARFAQPAPPPPPPPAGYGAPAPAPGWGAQPGYAQPAYGHGGYGHGYGRHGHRSLGKMLFSS